MKIALIGATGFVGGAILKEALNRKLQVSAILRNPGKLAVKDSHLSVVQADVMDTDRLSGLLRGSDVVVSAYNPGWGNPHIYDEFLKGAASVQSAVEKSGVKRLIVIGGGGSLFIAPGLQLVDSPQFPDEWKAGAQAARDYLNIIRKEDLLDWTFISPAIEMNPGTSGKRKGSYRTGLDNPVFDEHNKSIISVEDLAMAVIDEVEKPQHIRQRFTVAY